MSKQRYYLEVQVRPEDKNVRDEGASFKINTAVTATSEVAARRQAIEEAQTSHLLVNAFLTVQVRTPQHGE